MLSIAYRWNQALRLALLGNVLYVEWFFDNSKDWRLYCRHTEWRLPFERCGWIYLKHPAHPLEAVLLAGIGPLLCHNYNPLIIEHRDWKHSDPDTHEDTQTHWRLARRRGNQTQMSSLKHTESRNTLSFNNPFSCQCGACCVASIPLDVSSYK